jgi:glycosyltransferase involved in cell wall biosynthesis
MGNKIAQKIERNSVTKLLKGVIPAPLHPLIRRVVLFVVPPLQRQLAGTQRRFNRSKRRLRRMRKRLRRVGHKQLSTLHDACLSLWLYAWSMRRGSRPVKISNQIHIINPLTSYTGAPIQALRLFDEIKSHREVFLWSEEKVIPKIAEKYPVKRIVPWRFEFPKTGTLVFVGSMIYGPWVHYTYPRRIIYWHSSTYMTPEKFRERLRHLSNKGRRKVEVTYAADLPKRLVGYPGLIHYFFIDIDMFVPAASKPFESTSADYFTVGRLSSDLPYKHHPDDPELYRRLVDHGCRVKIMGASPSLKEKLGGLESVTLLPMLAQEAHLFLQELDCFFYRTSEEYLEAWGLVVVEAMACGLPVVCHNRGGYAEIIDHGQNGFLFDTQQEALEILLRLKEDRVLRESVGKAARRTAEELFSPAALSKVVEFYLR